MKGPADQLTLVSLHVEVEYGLINVKYTFSITVLCFCSGKPTIYILQFVPYL